MSKKLVYMVVDTETATLPFVNEIAHNENEKKTIAISKPLVYNIGWTLMYRSGEIISREEYVISEIFSVPSIFNTAYYKDKRPYYLEGIKNGSIKLADWNGAMKAFEYALQHSDFVGAFNSMFDFKKAIPFTELYINKLYSDNYYDWEEVQRIICRNIIDSRKAKKEHEFQPDIFKFRNHDYKLFDIWGMACKYLINNQSYKEKCLDNEMLTSSGVYFKTSAESTFRYLCKKYDFDEAHTALADAEIESYILSRILHDRAVEVGIDYFPFQRLGNTVDYVDNMRNTNKKKKYAQNVHSAMLRYLGEYEEDSLTPFQKTILRQVRVLEEIMAIE